MKRCIGMLVMATLACTGLSIAGDPKKELNLFQGNWKVASIKESDPKKIPPAEWVKTLGVNINGNVMKITEKGKNYISFNIKLDPTKKPKTIDMTHMEGPLKGKIEQGIYQIDGNTLTICSSDPGKDRPTVFATKDGTTISVVVFQKAK